MVMAFDPSNNRFYSGGGDKFLRVWDAFARPGSDRPEVELAERWYWEITRGFGGTVHALAVDPAGHRVAFAGVSARTASGDIAIYDAKRGRLETILPGHRQTVVSLDFSPDGRWLASVSKDGESRAWSVAAWESIILREAEPQLSDPRPALFLSNTRLALAVPNWKGEILTWWLLLYDVTHPSQSPEVLPTVYREALRTMARSRDASRWASADGEGRVYVGRPDDPTRAELLCQGQTATCLAFGSRERLFFTTESDGNRPSSLECWDLVRKQRMDMLELGMNEDSYACAASSDGRYIVTHSPANGGLIVCPLRGGDGRPISKPFAPENIRQIHSAGRPIRSVAFDKGGNYRLAIGVSSVSATGEVSDAVGRTDMVFDLDHGRLKSVAPSKATWKSPQTNDDGWTVTPAASRSALYLYQHGQHCGKIELDRAFQGLVRSYCWVTDRQKRLRGIAIGTQGQSGVFVYALPHQGQCRLLRYFRDHQALVTSLSCSADGRYLASGSVDQTIKIWSLEGVFERGRDFAREDAWGAELKVDKQQNRLVVTSALQAGIAARRGLRPGDVIHALQYFSQGQIEEVNEPSEMHRRLEQDDLWNTVILKVQHQGAMAPEGILLVPAWEPLATLYVDRSREWAFWTPQGYYDASVVGDELFGWLINRDRRLMPWFYRADRFRRELERPEVMRHLFRTGNLPDALEEAGVPLHQRRADRISELWQTQPRVQIEQPLRNASFAQGAHVRVVATVEYPAADADQYEVSCYANQVPMGEPSGQGTQQLRTYEWSLMPVADYNALRVSTTHKTLFDAGPFAKDDIAVRATLGPQRLPQLHVLAIAANDYPTEQLKFARADAESLINTLREMEGVYYHLGEVQTLFDSKITRDSVEQTIQHLHGITRDARPQDMLMVFLAGHGLASEGEYYFVPPDPRITNVQRGGPLIERLGISWTKLRELGDLHCRKVFLLDTCHSGNILDDEYSASHWKKSVRPIRRSEALVVTATDIDQVSFERDSVGHGIFTHAVLEGLRGKADGYEEDTPADGTVDLREVIRYVLETVPEAAQSMSGIQTPKYSPRRVWWVPLTPR